MTARGPTVACAAAAAALALVACDGGSLSFPSPLVIVSMSPQEGAADVPAVVRPSVTFGDEVDPGSIGAVTLEGPGGPVPVARSTDIGGRRVELAPASPLAPGTPFVLVVGPEVRRLSDGIALGTVVRARFWPAPPGTATPMSLLLAVPAPGTTAADPRTEISVTFSAELDCAAVVGDPGAGGPLVDFRVAVDGSPACPREDVVCEGADLACAPRDPLPPGATVTVALGAGLASRDGATLGQELAWQFTVAEDPAATPLVLVSARPGEGAAGVPATEPVAALFNLALDEALLAQDGDPADPDPAHQAPDGLLDHVVVATADGTQLPGAIAAGPAPLPDGSTGAEAVFTPVAPWPDGATLRVALSRHLRAAASAGGAPLLLPYEWSFAVGGGEVFAVAALSPVGGSRGALPGTQPAAVFTRAVSASSVVTEAPDPLGRTVLLQEGDLFDASAPSLRLACALDASGTSLGCTPAGPLRLGGTYTFTIRGGPGGVRAASGEGLPGDASASFGVGIDDVLLAVDPADGATDVPVAVDGAPRPICAVFAEDLDPATLPAGSFELFAIDGLGAVHALPLDASVPLELDGVDPATGAPGGSFRANRLCAHPAPRVHACGEAALALPYGATVQARLAAGVATVSGRATAGYAWSFGTARAPAVLGLRAENDLVQADPLDGATDVPVDAAIVVVLDAALDPASAGAARLTAGGAGGGAAVPVTAVVDGSVLRLVPLQPLAHDTLHELFLAGGTAGLRTAAGAPLPGPVGATFTTSPPTTAVLTPPSGQNLAATAVAAAVFSRPVHPPSLDASTFFAQDASGAVLSAVHAFHPDAPSAVVLVPVPAFPAGGQVTVQLTRGVRDERGNPIAAAAQISSGVDTAPAVSARQPDGLAAGALSPVGGAVLGGDGFVVQLPSPGTLRNRFLPTGANRQAVRLAAVGGGACPSGAVDLLLSFDVAMNAIRGRPAVPLVAGCSYDASVDPAALANLFLVSNGGAPVTARFVAETTRPSLVEVTVDGAAVPGPAGGLPAIAVRFSEPLDPATTAGALLARDLPTCVPGGAQAGCVPVTRTLVADTLTLSPEAPLVAGDTYVVRLGAPLADRAGNTVAATDRSFDVEAVAPRLVSSSPRGGATGVDPAAPLTVTFDEALSPASATGTRASAAGPVPGTVRLVRTADGVELSTCVSVAGATLAVAPDEPLQAAARHELRLDGVTDLAGTAAAPLTIPFTTR